MKKILLILILIFSCSKSKKITLDGYYFDDSSSIIYSFENSKIIKYNILDSIITEKKFVQDEHKLKINDGNFSFKKRNDTLILYNLPNTNKEITLKEIDYKNISSHKIDYTSWSMVVTQILREDNTKYKEEQLFRINLKEGIDAYYTKSNDTIYGDHFDSSGKMFNKFYAFKKDFITIVLVNINSNTLEMILCYGDQASIYSLKKVDLPDQK